MLSLDPANVIGDTWVDTSGQGNNATLFGTRYSPSFGGVLDFNGSTYAQRAAPLSTATIPGVAWTGTVWFKNDESPRVTARRIMTINRTPSNIGLQLKCAGSVCWFVGWTCGCTACRGAGTVSADGT